MKAEVKITAYDKHTERIMAAVTVPPQLLNEARRIAGVPASDPEIQGVYPLTPERIALIAEKAGFTLDPQQYDYCLEAFLPPPSRPATHTGVPRTRRERMKANAAKLRLRAAQEAPQ